MAKSADVGVDRFPIPGFGRNFRSRLLCLCVSRNHLGVGRVVVSAVSNLPERFWRDKQ